MCKLVMAKDCISIIYQIDFVIGFAKIMFYCNASHVPHTITNMSESGSKVHLNEEESTIDLLLLIDFCDIKVA